METKDNKETTSVEQPKWTARDAWKCAGFILLMTMCLLFLTIGITSRIQNPKWLNKSFTVAVFGLPLMAVYLLSSMYFAKSDSVREFARDSDLTKAPTRLAWLAILTAFIANLAYSASDYYVRARADDSHTLGFMPLNLTSFVTVVSSGLLAPFCEEIAVRGFLFRAFRSSYSLLVSTIVIIVFTLLTHFTTALVSWHSLIFFIVFGAFQCWLREKSASLWDCILGHITYNSLFTLRTWLV